MKHKFINKKTGAEARVIAMYLDSDGVMQVDGYDAVEDLMDDYAAYEEYAPPKEPLIKDEKIRKAIRAWAEVVPSAKVRYDNYIGRIYTHSDCIMSYSISFPARLELDGITDYTIAELCGEEE